MAVMHLTTDNFNETIENNDIVLIDFWANWCGPCRTFKPIFEAAAEANQDLTFGSCDTEEQTELAAGLGIRSIPTLMVFREKVLLYAQPGMLPAENLDDLIRQVRELDMAKVHAEVAKQKESERAAAGQ
jgi:thioredoxin 1